MIITQFHNLTNTVNRATLTTKITDLANNQTMTAIMGNIAGIPANWLSVIFGECSPIEIVSNIMKWCDY